MGRKKRLFAMMFVVIATTMSSQIKNYLRRHFKFICDEFVVGCQIKFGGGSVGNSRSCIIKIFIKLLIYSIDYINLCTTK